MQCVLYTSFCNCNYITLYRIFIIYAIANHKFPKEYSDLISIQIDPHLKMLLENTKGS